MTASGDAFPDRYSRQVLFSPIGRAGQARLERSRAVLVGCGALGSGILEMLARAGVGCIRFVDRDFVEDSNLQRQSLYTEEDARSRRPKALAAHRALTAINGALAYEPRVADFNASNALEIVRDADVLLDGTDNVETRLLLNEAAVKTGTPWVYGGCVASGGVVMPVLPGRTPCLRCILPPDTEHGDLPTCDTLGIIAPAARIVSSVEAALALRILAGDAGGIRPFMLHFDCWTGDFHRMDLEGARHEACPVCVRGEFPKLAGEGLSRTTVLCGRNMVQVDFPAADPRARRPDFAALRERLSPLGEVSCNAYMLTFTCSPHQLVLFPDGRCLVRGTASPEEAKSLYARYIGL